MRKKSCSLCGRDEPLRNSHIIPEFAFKTAYDQKHRVHVLSTFAQRPPPFAQKGVREPLLCAACETQLSQFERYVSRVIEGGESIGVKRIADVIEVSGLDYARFKLFALSVLWRAGVAKRPMFSQVQLGRHEPVLRDMILRCDPGPYDRYGVVVLGIVGDKGTVADFIDQPERVPLNGHTCYRFVIAGFMWLFFVSSHRPKEIFRSHFLQDNGTLRIYRKRFEELGFLRSFGKRLDAMGRLIAPSP